MSRAVKRCSRTLISIGYMAFASTSMGSASADAAAAMYALQQALPLQTLILAQVHGHPYKPVNLMRTSLLMQMAYSLQAAANSQEGCTFSAVLHVCLCTIVQNNRSELDD